MRKGRADARRALYFAPQANAATRAVGWQIIAPRTRARQCRGGNATELVSMPPDA